MIDVYRLDSLLGSWQDRAVETRRRLLREVLVVLSLYLLPALVVPSGLPAEGLDLRSLILTTARNLVFSLLIIYLADLRAERALLLGSAEASRRFPAGTAGLAVFVATTLFVLSLLVGAVAARFSPETPGVGEVLPALAASHPAVVWVPVVVIAMAIVGLTEELLFRAYLLHRFRRLEVPPIPAVVLAAGIFSLGHGYQGIAAMVFAFLAGICLGLLWLRFPRLPAFAIGHGSYNLAVLLISAADSAIF